MKKRRSPSVDRTNFIAVRMNDYQSTGSSFGFQLANTSGEIMEALLEAALVLQWVRKDR